MHLLYKNVCNWLNGLEVIHICYQMHKILLHCSLSSFDTLPKPLDPPICQLAPPVCNMYKIAILGFMYKSYEQCNHGRLDLETTRSGLLLNA